MIYRMDTQLRYSESGSDGRMTIPALINYLQDCAIFQSDMLGHDKKFLAEIGRAWLLSGWQIHIDRMPVYGEKITIETWPGEMKKVLALRYFRVTDSEGKVIAKIVSEWIFFDTKRLRPARLDEDTARRFMPEPPLDVTITKRHLDLPDNMEECESVKVVKRDIDTNGHVNNCRYVEWADNLLPAGFETKTVRVEYRKQAMPGDTVVPYINESENCIIVSLRNEAGEVFANVEFEGENL